MKQPSSALSSYQKAQQAENHNGSGIPLKEDVLTTAASSDTTAVEEHDALYASLSWENGNISNQNDNTVGQSDDDGGNDYCDGHAPPPPQDHLDSSCQERLISASPDLAPIPWSIINLLLLVWSGGLMVAIYYFEHEQEHGGRKKRKANRANRWRSIYRTDLYVIWNLVTTWVWCWEMGLKILYRKRKSTWTNLAEFGVAVYFLFDSLTMLQLIFELKSDKDVKGEFIDGLISFLGYFYELVESLYLFRKKWKQEHHGVELQQQEVPIWKA